MHRLSADAEPDIPLEGKADHDNDHDNDYEYEYEEVSLTLLLVIVIVIVIVILVEPVSPHVHILRVALRVDPVQWSEMEGSG